MNLFLEKEMEIFQAPLVEEFNPEKIHTNIRSFQIEDLLNREPICIENEEVRLIHENKSVLVTGGAGSIGSEIVRKVASYHPSKLVVVDQAETPLHEIQLEMNEKFPEIDTVVADAGYKTPAIAKKLIDDGRTGHFLTRDHVGRKNFFENEILFMTM